MAKNLQYFSIKGNKRDQFITNEPVYTTPKNTSIGVNNPPLTVPSSEVPSRYSIDGEIIELQKRHYGTKDASQLLDRSFTELTRTRDSLTPENFFNLYRELFYNIPKIGENSHTALIKESKEYVDNYQDEKDERINELIDELIKLEREQIDFPSEHPLFRNGTALKIDTIPDGPLGIMQEGRLRRVSNATGEKGLSPFGQLKRALGFVDPDGKLLPDNDCFTFVTYQTWQSLPKWEDIPGAVNTKIDEQADWGKTLNDFKQPISNVTSISTLIDSSTLNRTNINFLINKLKTKFPASGFTIEDNETFTWTLAELAPFSTKGQVQGEVRIRNEFNQTNFGVDPNLLVENIVSDWNNEIQRLGFSLTGNLENDIADKIDEEIERDGSGGTAVVGSTASDVQSADNSLINELNKELEDISNSKYISYIWNVDPNRDSNNSVKFFWVQQDIGAQNALKQQLLKRINDVATLVTTKQYNTLTSIGANV
tara:strand:- start:1929 stop:3377 length:1449 start_codon:yes stop_codon:yes gene_type:complete